MQEMIKAALTSKKARNVSSLNKIALATVVAVPWGG